ncbi:LOW QUALITY PROTEIN: Retrovirus Polyprotein [Phytophthora megakarya]|uniref:Retrovirus Polyprotein n=1 Tax=Phytophthora megakarya TaxID=4795 RepID=A0A225W8G9_9STRA|nr:LOW QUALITY PROTEIN: Retrovirus Polyprotein [Phytophthora megakarya]
MACGPHNRHTELLLSVSKKAVGWRIVHDYRVMNNHTFWMRDADIKYTPFQRAHGSYEYLVIPMGLSNAPATFNDWIRRLLNDLTDFCLSYFDDIYIFTRGNDSQSHLDALDTVLIRLEENNFYVKRSKCKYRVLEIILDEMRYELKPIVLRDWPLSKTKNKLQSFLGTATYVQRFCAGFANDAGPIFDMLKKDNLKNNKNIECSEHQKQHFESLKQRISATPILAVVDFSKPFYMRMDASEYAIGGVLFQLEEHDGKLCERPHFKGVNTKRAEKNYSIREKELLAILYGRRVWRVYLLDKPFIVETDHKSLEIVFTQKIIFATNCEMDCVRLEVITAKMVSSRVKNGLSPVVTEASERNMKHKKSRFSFDGGKRFYTGPNDEVPRFVLPDIKELINAILFEFHDVEC